MNSRDFVASFHSQARNNRDKQKVDDLIMRDSDKPSRGSDRNIRSSAEPDLHDRIVQLLHEQDYAVLCVQGGGQPYGALVAVAFSEDLRHAVFATPVTTRKYRLLTECDHVALVLDNRSGKQDELMEVEAVTVTGHASLLDRGAAFDKWAALLLSRHPYLKSFVRATSCALFRVEVVRFLHVVRFQEVRQWVPTARS